MPKQEATRTFPSLQVNAATGDAASAVPVSCDTDNLFYKQGKLNCGSIDSAATNIALKVSNYDRYLQTDDQKQDIRQYAEFEVGKDCMTDKHTLTCFVDEWKNVQQIPSFAFFVVLHNRAIAADGQTAETDAQIKIRIQKPAPAQGPSTGKDVSEKGKTSAGSQNKSAEQSEPDPEDPIADPELSLQENVLVAKEVTQIPENFLSALNSGIKNKKSPFSPLTYTQYLAENPAAGARKFIQTMIPEQLAAYYHAADTAEDVKEEIMLYVTSEQQEAIDNWNKGQTDGGTTSAQTKQQDQSASPKQIQRLRPGAILENKKEWRLSVPLQSRYPTVVLKFEAKWPDAARMNINDHSIDVQVSEPGNKNYSEISFRKEPPFEDCHPAGSKVNVLVNNANLLAPIETVRIGDLVKTPTGAYEPIIAIPHSLEGSHDYIALTAGPTSSTLFASKNHLVFCNGRETAASKVRVGDYLRYNGADARVSSVLHTSMKGAYHLTVPSGAIVVDGFDTSVHTDCMPLWLQVWVTTPLLHFLYLLGFAVDYGATPARAERCIGLLGYYGYKRADIASRYGQAAESVLAVFAGFAVFLLAYLPEVLFIAIAVLGLSVNGWGMPSTVAMGAAAWRHMLSHSAVTSANLKEPHTSAKVDVR